MSSDIGLVSGVTKAPRYPLLFNPKARSQRAQRAARFIMERATRFAMYATSSPEEARDLAAKFAADGAPVVVAAGAMARSMPCCKASRVRPRLSV